MLKKNLLIVITLMITYFLYNLIFIGSDEKQIKSLLNNIKKVVYIDGTLKKQQIFNRTLSLKEAISRDVKINIFEKEKILHESSNFDSIQGAAFMGAKYLSEHNAIIQDIDIEVEKPNGKVDLVIISEGTTIENDSFKELFSATVRFTYIKDKWVIVAIEGERMTSEYE